MRNLLPGSKKGLKKSLPIGEIAGVRLPLVPFPEVLERIRLYDTFSRDLPPLKVVSEYFSLLLPQVPSLEPDWENIFNFLTYSHMQLSTVPVEWVVWADLTKSVGTTKFRTAVTLVTRSYEDKLFQHLEALKAQTGVGLPEGFFETEPEEEEEEEPLPEEEDEDYQP